MKRSRSSADFTTVAGPTHVVVYLTSVMDGEEGYYLSGEISLIGDTNPLKIQGSCPSDRNILGLAFRDDNGMTLPQWTTLEGKVLYDFQCQHHCLFISCKYDE